MPERKLNLKDLLLIFALSTVPTLILWLPFILRSEIIWSIPLPTNGLATIVANYDGPLYIVVAKTLYNGTQIASNYSFGLSLEYYAAHFPLFPFLIRLFSPLPGGYTYSMLGVTLVSSFIAILYFFKYINLYVKKDQALWITTVFAVLPARWLIVRSVGSPEPLFMAGIIASIYYFKDKRYWLATLWGIVAQLTKSPGMLLFFAYVAHISVEYFHSVATKHLSSWHKYLPWKTLPLLLMPLSLLGLFYYYSIVFGDFFAYFNSGDNIHLLFPPFQVFNYSAPWVGTFWLEEVVILYLLGTLGLLHLIKQKKNLEAWFVGIFLVSIFFVSHRDILRYALPIVPFLFAAWAKLLVSHEFKIALAVIMIPIFLYSLTFISQNVMPISDWAPFL